MSAPLAYDATYLKSISGILKICCMICCFLGFLCIVCSSVHLHNFRGCFYNTCVIVAFICTLLVLLARLYQLWQRKFYKFNAVKYEFYLHVFLAFTCFTAGCVTISLDVLSYTIATFFAFLAFSFYVFDAYLGYRLNRLCDAQTQTTPQPPV
ncbi:hypothetical protein FF38_01129 [Lucilia cuprina]|uniref:MARVEL domain-containing protein n=1 Tax=Lucilia cuprina TaxID=7375 RepID=A0A0L0C452_LUCCU|nr:uncharacterized protein LOC111685317 [Lucilia cuprina]XP_037826360.1 uncharacterized protein LOC119614294 [Lucilia sericata]KAI8116379.1 hypothetical protein CVS40_11549 [Lucilia cuprina]KNC26254.1 hypothetical protein FF38_01129 [Lucilia cuprina]